MIQLGLTRITRLLRNTPIPWKAVHVAGTNGKGSVCAYASAMLHASGVKCGRFTSPHLIDRWDCITVGEETVSPNLFHEVEVEIQADNKSEDIGASEFEILTATAFEIFHRLQVEVGVVEVGLGGTHDATNILQHPAVTVITKIGQDHESYLGRYIEDIAAQKAGIIKPNAPCLADGTSEPVALEVLRQHAKDRRASSFQLVPQEISLSSSNQGYFLSRHNFAPHQKTNIQLAYQAVQSVLGELGKTVPLPQLLTAIQKTSWAGRLQTISLKSLLSSEREALLDGAHNPQAADVLGSYVDSKLRREDSSVSWLIAISEGKDAQQILRKILRPHDSIVAVAFGTVEGMPWVKAIQPDAIVEAARTVCRLQHTEACGQDLEGALQAAADFAENRPLVIAGSLYLVSQILRLERDLTVA